jgi:hypothetical protein
MEEGREEFVRTNEESGGKDESKDEGPFWTDPRNQMLHQSLQSSTHEATIRIINQSRL